jgi:HlyD family secretion protein
MKIKSPIGIILGVIALCCLAAAGGFWLRGQLVQAPPVMPPSEGDRLGRLPSFGKLRAGEKQTSVAALGRLTPRGEVVHIGGLMGDRLGKLQVEEDAWVKKGDVLGYLESYEERKAERDTFAAQLAEAKARLAAELALLDAQIKEAEIGVQQAKTLDPLDVDAQKAKVQILEDELATAQTDLDRLSGLTTPGAVSQQKLDQQAQLVRRFRQELSAAKAMLAKSTSGRELNSKRAQAVLDAARAGRKKAQASAQLDSLSKNLALAEVRLQRTILRAPHDGAVLKIIARPGERVDQKPILKLGDTHAMYAVAEVYQTDVGLVQPGQRATVTSPALTEALTGTVERVGRIIYKNDVLSVDPAASADARVVEVWIRLDTSEAASRMTNLQVDVLIDLGKSQR